MDTQTQAWLDQFGAYITEVIRRHGWFTAGATGWSSPKSRPAAKPGVAFG